MDKRVFCFFEKNTFHCHFICCRVSRTVSSLIFTSGFLMDDLH